MKVIITGAGRMGQRHAQGIAAIDEVELIELIDINDTALANASAALQEHANAGKFRFSHADELKNKRNFDVGIMASTANDRGALFNLLADAGCKNILVEKPLAQSYEQVLAFEELVTQSDVNAFVNLNMRLYDNFLTLRNDLRNTQQLQGFKNITINTGTIGIGANGIHYLDLLYFLMDADEAKINCAHVDECIIPSGRGAQFCDFGGWAVIDFYSSGQPVAVALVSLSATSTVFGSWEIVAPNGRVYFNEVEQKRIDTIRKADSTMPVNRYAADYLLPQEKPFPAVFLGDLTAKWIKALIMEKHILPTVKESLPVHELLFQWLAYSKTHKDLYPIT